MDLLSDPLFVAASIVGVCLLGLSKGGFFGLGMMALPLMAITVPPMQAAAILLPTVLAQDALTIWAYRRDWSAWNLKIMIPSMAVGIVIATLLAASLSATHIRLAIGLIAFAFVLRHWLGRRFDRLAARSNALTGVAFGALGGFTTMLANAGGPAWQIHLLPQGLDKLTKRHRPAHVRESRGRRGAAAGGGDRQLCGHLAGAAHAGRIVLPHRLRADVPDRDRADARLAGRAVAGVTRRHAQ